MHTIFGGLKRHLFRLDVEILDAANREPRTRNGNVKCAFAHHQLNSGWTFRPRSAIDANANACMCLWLRDSHMQWSNVDFKREKKNARRQRPTERTASVAATDEHVNRECVSKCNYCWIIETYAPLVFHSFPCTQHSTVGNWCATKIREKKIHNFLFVHSLEIHFALDALQFHYFQSIFRYAHQLTVKIGSEYVQIAQIPCS